MKIIVCVKMVPAITDVKFNPNSGTLIRDNIESEMNPFDTYAVEEGIRLKEKNNGSTLVLSMGPPQAEHVLREALALGCDEAILLSDMKFSGADTLATSYTLSRAINKVDHYDLIICGHKTTDGDTAQVGPGLAEWLDIPHVSYVRKIVEVNENSIVVNRSIDVFDEEIEVSPPCLITVTKEINEPRLPSFKRKIEARKMPVLKWTHEDIDGKGCFGLDGSPTRVIKIFNPPPRGGGTMLEGDIKRQVQQLITKLKEGHML